MAKTTYAYVVLDHKGQLRPELMPEQAVNLNGLLVKGWEPVRETPFPLTTFKPGEGEVTNHMAYILILLKKSG
jgi:hypothetical protein